MAIIRYSWNFGDGSKSAQEDPTHTYKAPGVYNWYLEVEDHLGNTATSSGTIIVTSWSETAGSLNVSRTNKSYRYGENIEQGVGFSENTGASWPFPEARSGIVKIWDDNGQLHVLVLDNDDGRLYDITTRDGPSGYGLSRVNKDGVLTDDTGGTEIAPKATFGEDRGTAEHYFLEHLESHIYARPLDESVGLPSGLELDLEIYKDGEPTTASATTEGIPVTGDITYDKQVDNAHRLQTKLLGNKAPHRITGRQQYYEAADRATKPSNRIMTEDDYQSSLSAPVLWGDVIFGILKNRYNGSEIGTYTTLTGPDGTKSGVSFTSAITFGSVTLTGAGVLMLWYQGTIAVTIGGAAVALTDSGATVNSWQLAYAEAINKTGNLIITPTGTGKVFDVRSFSSAISSATRTYYYNDINDNSGKIVLPR